MYLHLLLHSAHRIWKCNTLHSDWKFADQLNNQGIDPNDGSNDVEQAEDVPVTHKYKRLVQYSSRQCDQCAQTTIKCI